MSLRSMYNKFDEFVRFVFRYTHSRSLNKHHTRDLKNNGIKIRKLTKEQKEEVYKTWKRKKYVDIRSFELYYSATGIFDPNICPEMLFRIALDPCLNSRELNLAWADKCYFDRFSPETNWPHSIVRNVNGVFYDHDYNIISAEQAKELVVEEKNCIIKPSLISGCGQNVQLLCAEDDIEDVFAKFNKNYVIQKLIRQHEIMSQFSSQSVSIVRMNTLLLNGKAHVLSSSLRCSTVDSITDNGAIGDDGEGMIIVGVENDGNLKETGYYANGRATQKLPNGTNFNGICLPNFDQAIKEVEKAHEGLGHFGLLAWDVTFDEKGTPVVIEYNLNGMGAFYYQIACGPLFGEQTQNVVNLLQEGKR